MALEFELKEDDDDDDDGEEEEGKFFGLEAFMAAQSAKDVHERHLAFPRSIHNKISQPHSPFSYISFRSEKGGGGVGEVRFPIFTQNNTFWKQRFAISLSLSFSFFFFSLFARRIRLGGGAFCFGGEEFFHFLVFL